MSKILAFAGSTRADSFNRKLARAAAEAIRKKGAEVTLVNLGDYPMPLYEGDLEASQGLPPMAKAFKELMRDHDGFAIASPEYNGSFPALVKNVIDWVSRPTPGEPPLAAFRGKIAALFSASPGQGGGRRGLKHVRELLEMIGVTVLGEQVLIPRAAQAFDAASELARPEDREAVERLAADLYNAVESKQQAA
jgi:NAD(P)H-dependent FMN reductase